jgi:hypothetical protein
MKCISIPECTQRLSHLTTLGGQHGQESEEGEEGEERSEENCEEDPQGRQEEVSSLELAAGDFVAGTSFGADRVDLTQSEKLRATQRGCRRDIRSNGWIELSRSARASKAGPAEENRFSSFGADCLKSAIPPTTSWSMGSGPDVFADALAPARGSCRPAFQFSLHYHLPRSLLSALVHGHAAGTPVASMVIRLRNPHG